MVFFMGGEFMLGKLAFAALAIAAASLASIGLARPALAAAGGLDPTFGTGGKVLTDLGDNSAGAQINAVVSDAALQSNGDIVVSGNFGLVRYLSNGKLDTSFGTSGLAATAGAAAGLAIEPNGDYLAVGAGTASGGVSGFEVTRFTSAGQIDPTFGSNGVVTTAFPGASDGASADAVLVEPDGDILVAGQADVPGTTRNEPVITDGALALYNANGTLDTSFGSGGVVQSTSSIGNITNVGIDASGDIFVLPARAEFSPSGQLDSSVTPETITASSTGGDNAFLPDGQSVSAASVGVAKHNTDVQVTMFNANGTVDSAFDNPPFTFTGAELAGFQSPGAVAVQPNGQIVVVGSDFKSTSVFGAARLDTSGSLDSGFGTAGVLTTSFQGDDGATAVLIQPNGDIVAIGFSEDNATGVTDIALARYLG
jgi:uncharacterized delta-60 repeat protein